MVRRSPEYWRCRERRIKGCWYATILPYGVRRHWNSSTDPVTPIPVLCSDTAIWAGDDRRNQRPPPFGQKVDLLVES